MAWTDHAAAMEEGVAARDDLRTSLGQAVRGAPLHRARRRRCTPGSPTCVSLEARISRRTGMLLHGVLAATALVGVALVVDDRLDTASLVTLFLVTTMFVGQVDQLARHLPDLQAGFGAVIRLRGLLAAEREPDRRRATCPTARSTVPFRRPALRLRTGHASPCSDVDLHVPAGYDVRPRRPHRLRQVDAGLAAVPRGRARARLGAARRRRRPSTSTCSSCARRSASSPSAPRSWPARSRRTSRSSPTSRAPTVERRGRRARPRPPGSPACPEGSTPRSARAAPACPPARSSWSRSPGCWCATSGSWCSTRRPRGWTRSPRPASCAPPSGCSPAAPASWSPTGSRRPSAPSRSRCSTAAASSSRVRGTTSRSGRAVPRPARRLGRGRVVAAATVDDSAARRLRSAPHRRTGAPPPAARAAGRSPAWPAPPSSPLLHRAAVGPRQHGPVPGVPRSPARSARSPAGSGATSSSRPPARRAPRRRCVALLVVSLLRLAAAAGRRRSAATRSGGSR